MMNLKENSVLFALYTLLGYPLFYFVYKYSVPYFGTIDFFDYYKLYESMDYKAADSPLNMRLLGSFFVYLLSKTGLVYNTDTNIDHEDFQKSIYFCATFLNFVWVVLTCVMIFRLARLKEHSLFFSVFGGMVYLLGFGTMFFELMPLMDALAIFLFTVVLWFYLKRSHWIIIPLILLIFQREYIFLALGFLCLIEFIRSREKYFIQVLCYTILCFGIYVVLRKLFFETPRYSHHTNVNYMKDSLSNLRFPVMPFLRQTLMTMNITLIYLFVVVYKRFKRMEYNKAALMNVILLLVQIVVIALLLALGNNTGRYFYILVPLVILYLMDELKPLAAKLMS